jgi:hypothetical protein
MKHYCPNCFGTNIHQLNTSFQCDDCHQIIKENEFNLYQRDVASKISAFQSVIGIYQSQTDGFIDQSKSELETEAKAIDSYLRQNRSDNNDSRIDLYNTLKEIKIALARLNPVREVDVPTSLKNFNNYELIKFLVEEGGMNSYYLAAFKLRASVERQLKDKHGFVTMGKENRICVEKNEYLKLFSECFPQKTLKKDDFKVIYDAKNNKEYVSLNNVLKYFKVLRHRGEAQNAADKNNTLHLFVHESKENDDEIKALFPTEAQIKDFILESLHFFKGKDLFFN